MSADSAVLAGRAAAEAQMKDQCLIIRSGGELVWNEAAGSYVTPPPVTVYSGRCKVKAPRTAVSTADVAARQVTIVPGEVHLPVVSDDYSTDPATGRPYVPTDDDEVSITAVGPRSDPALLDCVFTISGPMIGSDTTARRLPAKAVI